MADSQLTFFLFRSIKHVFCHFSCHGRYEMCSKLKIKTRIHKVNNKVKDKGTIDVIFASL